MVELRSDRYGLFRCGFAEGVLRFLFPTSCYYCASTPVRSPKLCRRATLIAAKSGDFIVVRNVCAVAER